MHTHRTGPIDETRGYACLCEVRVLWQHQQKDSKVIGRTERLAIWVPVPQARPEHIKCPAELLRYGDVRWDCVRSVILGG